MEKRLTCSTRGKIEATIDFCPTGLSDAIKAAIEGRDKLGLQIARIENGYKDSFRIVLMKEDTPEHFSCFALEAKRYGW